MNEGNPAGPADLLAQLQAQGAQINTLLGAVQQSHAQLLAANPQLGGGGPGAPVTPPPPAFVGGHPQPPPGATRTHHWYHSPYLAPTALVPPSRPGDAPTAAPVFHAPVPHQALLLSPPKWYRFFSMMGFSQFSTIDRYQY